MRRVKKQRARPERATTFDHKPQGRESSIRSFSRDSRCRPAALQFRAHGTAIAREIGERRSLTIEYVHRPIPDDARSCPGRAGENAKRSQRAHSSARGETNPIGAIVKAGFQGKNAAFALFPGAAGDKTNPFRRFVYNGVSWQRRPPPPICLYIARAGGGGDLHVRGPGR